MRIKWVVASLLFLTVLLWSGCAVADEEPISPSANDPTTLACDVRDPRYPTTAEDFERLYRRRGFYTDGNHLGRDLDIPEGTAIHPIGCGVIRVYRAASGYGTLVVVVEHRLARPIRVLNGDDRFVSVSGFLSIYGHLRSSARYGGENGLAWHTGDTVRPYDTIGYIQNDRDNGDGAEHLHLGIRLQTMEQAQSRDASWFRGYDGIPSQRGWFADPAEFLSVLLEGREMGAEDGSAPSDSTDVIADALEDGGAPDSDLDRDGGSRADADRLMDAASVTDLPLTDGPSIDWPMSWPIDIPSILLDAAVSAPDVSTGRGDTGASSSATPDASALPAPDAGMTSVPDVHIAYDTSPPRVEICNGIDDDGDGAADETFACIRGRRGAICVTRCGALGYVMCESDCRWSTVCYPFPEDCDNTIDDDCNGLVDCADPVCREAIRCRAVRDAGAPTLDTGMSVDVPLDTGRADTGRPDVPTDTGSVPDVPGLDVPTDTSGSTPLDAGIDVPSDTGSMRSDAGMETGADSGIDIGSDTGIDTGRDSATDAGTDAGTDTGVVDSVSPPTDTGIGPYMHRLTIRLDPAAMPVCAAGWQIIVYDGSGIPHESAPGAALSMIIPDPLRGQWVVSTHCGSWYLVDWPGPAGRPAREGGVLSITLDGRELALAESLLCYDRWSPTPGVRPVIPLERYYEGRCP